jgi:hypothetical protein
MTMRTSNLRAWLGAGALMALPIVAACSKGITTPSSGGAPQTELEDVLPPPQTISGVVRTTDGAPVPRAAVSFRWACADDSSCIAEDELTADDAGRYAARIQPRDKPATGVRLWAYARSDGYLPRCAASAPPGDFSIDLWLAPATGPAGPLPQSAPGSRTVSGTVFENSPAGRAPVRDAQVAWYMFYDYMAATRTDSEGRYSLCGIPEQLSPDSGLVLASKTGYLYGRGSVETSGDAIVDVELRPNAAP